MELIYFGGSWFSVGEFKDIVKNCKSIMRQKKLNNEQIKLFNEIINKWESYRLEMNL